MVSNPIESASKVIGIENTLVPGVALVVSKNIDGIGVGTASGGFGAAVPHSKAGQGGRASDGCLPSARTGGCSLCSSLQA